MLNWRTFVRIFSGIQPTGRKHVGNYIGAIRGWVENQDRGDPTIHCMVDLHATSIAYDPQKLPDYVLDTTAMLIAAGLDPERCILFRQSDVREHTELCWLLASVTAYGDLLRMHQFKEKSAREQQLVRTSLFLYPVLQAADILLYKTDEVPVGDDQRQHLELAREIARRFNTTYGDVFVEPEHVIPEIGARIMDLQDPGAKMSTSSSTEAGLIYIDDEPDAIIRKVRRAQTDSGAEIVRAPGKEGIANLVEVMAVARGVEPEQVESEFDGQGYGAFKQAVGDAVVEVLRPVRERYLELRPDEAGLQETLRMGAERAGAIASPLMTEVRRAMGVGPPT
jgi:tryptophanyl-tRNA synthetase